MMNINIEVNKNLIVTFSDDLIPDYEFSMDKEVNLTEFVTALSSLNENITVTPENKDEFYKKYPDSSEEIRKISEYLYKIINAYIICYEEVFSA